MELKVLSLEEAADYLSMPLRSMKRRLIETELLPVIKISPKKSVIALRDIRELMNGSQPTHRLKLDKVIGDTIERRAKKRGVTASEWIENHLTIKIAREMVTYKPIIIKGEEQ